jgi:hypothetical protein
VTAKPSLLKRTEELRAKAIWSRCYEDVGERSAVDLVAGVSHEPNARLCPIFILGILLT